MNRRELLVGASAVIIGAVLGPTVARGGADALGARLAAYYGSRRGYRAVRADAMAWHGTTRNACVAFASTALRHLGVHVPRRDADGSERTSRLTAPFVAYLEQALGWARLDDIAALAPGDLAFTTDAPCCPGYPAHVVVFARWHQPRRHVAIVIDNGGRGRRRPMLGDAARDLDAFAFALRPG